MKLWHEMTLEELIAERERYREIVADCLTRRHTFHSAFSFLPILNRLIENLERKSRE